MFEMSAVQHFALGVEIILLTSILNDSIPAVWVVTLPKYSRRSPPDVNLERKVSSYYDM